MPQSNALSLQPTTCPILAHYGKPPERVNLRDLQNNGFSSFINLLTAAASHPDPAQRLKFGYMSIKDFWSTVSIKQGIWGNELDRFETLMRQKLSFVSSLRAQQLVDHKPTDLPNHPIIDIVLKVLNERVLAQR